MTRKQQIRESFRQSVFNRDHNKCVMCGKSANLDAHHIMDRALFSDGGYFLDNGVTLCPDHHIMAENGTISCETLRQKANITKICLPGGFNPWKTFDKWGRSNEE